MGRAPDDARRGREPGTGGDDGLDAQIGRLPAAYAAVLRGILEGVPDAQLAERAGVDPSALPAFVRVAIAKLLDTDENA